MKQVSGVSANRFGATGVQISVCGTRKGKFLGVAHRTSSLASSFKLVSCLGLLTGSKFLPSSNLTSMKVSFLLTFDILDNLLLQCQLHVADVANFLTKACMLSARTRHIRARALLNIRKLNLIGSE